MTSDDSPAPPPGEALAEAVELAPRSEGDPAPEVLVYRTGAKPVLDVFTAGGSRQGIVRERLRFPDGSTAYAVMLDPGEGRHEVRTYRWPTGLRVRFVPGSVSSL